jgi:hypothetical protein
MRRGRLLRLDDLADAHLRELEPVGRHSRGDSPERSTRAPHIDHSLDGILLFGDGHQCSVPWGA